MSFFRPLLTFLCIAQLLTSNVVAATINATSCSQSDVQAAITAASIGDTVNIPAGDCTWNSGVTLTKNLTIQGAGIGNTIIRINTSTAFSTGSSAAFKRITGIEFDYGTTGGAGIYFLYATENGWRVDNCKFDATNATSLKYGVYVRGDRTRRSFGLVDSCIMINTQVGHLGDANVDQYTNNTGMLPLGTANAVYVENCNMSYTVFSHAIDSNYGGSYVFRFNTVKDTYIEAHSVQGPNRAVRFWEVYNNNINQVDSGQFAPFRLRGGTGVVFNNTITGTFSLPKIALDNVRSCPFEGTHTGVDNASILTNSNASFPSITGFILHNITDESKCTITSNTTKTATCTLTGGIDNDWDTGDEYKIGRVVSDYCGSDSPWDGNEPGQGGYPCRDQIGRATDAWLWTVQNPYPPQALEPAYAWSNTVNANPLDFYVIPYCNGDTSHIRENRDFYNYTPNFNGTVGVGSGTLASRPVTCTTGVGYWATDQNKLYKCSSTNIWKEYYTPFTYPHPLRQPQVGDNPPESPKNLRIPE